MGHSFLVTALARSPLAHLPSDRRTKVQPLSTNSKSSGVFVKSLSGGWREARAHTHAYL